MPKEECQHLSKWALQHYVPCIDISPKQPSASDACSAVLNLPKSVNLNKVAKLLVCYQAAGNQGGIKLQAVHRTANLLQILQAIGIGLTLPGVDIVVNKGVCRQGPGVRLYVQCHSVDVSGNNMHDRSTAS